MSLTLAVAITDSHVYKIAHDVWTGASILEALTQKVSHGVFPKESSETLKLYAYGMVGTSDFL